MSENSGQDGDTSTTHSEYGRRRMMVATSTVDHGGDGVVQVPPTRSVVHRAAPELFLKGGAPATDFFSSMHKVKAWYEDPVAEIRHYSEMFFDGSSKICLGRSGELISSNVALGANAQRVRERSVWMLSRIVAGDFSPVASEHPLAILSTPRHGNYYHFLFDDVARLGLYDCLSGAKHLRFVVPSPRDWQGQVYDAFGITPRLCSVAHGIFHLRDVWMAPRGLTRIANFRSRGFDRIASLPDKLALQQVIRPTRRLYVSREATSHRRLVNEADVQNYLGASGFEVVRPEALSIKEQVELFGEAAIVVGVFGAGLTNTAFMVPGSTVLEIAPPTNEFAAAHNAIFSTMCGLGELRYGLVVGDQFDPKSNDFRIPIPWLDCLMSHFVNS